MKTRDHLSGAGGRWWRWWLNMRVQCPPIRSHLNSVDLKQTEKCPFYSFFIILHCLSEVIPAKSCIDSKKINAVIGEEAKNHAIHLFLHFKYLLWNYWYIYTKWTIKEALFYFFSCGYLEVQHLQITSTTSTNPTQQIWDKSTCEECTVELMSIWPELLL